jgi:hypothetical protein
MRDEILAMCLEAMRRTSFPDASPASLRTNPAHAAAIVALLRDCHPLPVVRELIDEYEAAARGKDA